MCLRDLKRVIIFLGILSFIFINFFISFFEYNIKYIYEISSIPLVISLVISLLLSNKKLVKSYISTIFQNKTYLQRYFNPFANPYFIIDDKFNVLNYNDKFLEILDKISIGNYYDIKRLEDLNLLKDFYDKLLENINKVYEIKDKIKFNFEISKYDGTHWFSVSVIPFIFDDINTYISVVIKEYSEEMKLKIKAENIVKNNSLLADLLKQIEKAKSFEEVYLISQENINQSNIIYSYLVFESYDLVYYNLLHSFSVSQESQRLFEKYFINKSVIIHNDCVKIDEIVTIDNLNNLFPFMSNDDIQLLNKIQENRKYLSFSFKLDERNIAIIFSFDSALINLSEFQIFLTFLKNKLVSIYQNNQFNSSYYLDLGNFDKCESPYLIVDEKLSIKFVNSKFKLLFNYKDNNSLDDYLENKEIEIIKKIINESIENQAIYVKIIQIDGKLYNYLLNLLPINYGQKIHYLISLINQDEVFHIKNDYRDLYYQFNTIFNSIPLFTFILDLNGNIVSSNKAANDIINILLGKNKIQNQNLVSLLPDIFANDFNNFIKRAQKGEAIELEKEYLFNNEHINLKIKIQPILNELAVVQNILLIVQDIRPIKQLEELKNEITFKNKFDVRNIPDPVVVLDLLGNIIYVNNQFLTDLGYNDNEIIGKNITLLTSKSFFIQLKKLYNTANKFCISGGFKNKEDKEIYYSVNAKLLEHGRVICTLRKEDNLTKESSQKTKLELYEIIINNLYSPIIVIDKQFKIIYKNKSFNKQFILEKDSDNLKDYIKKDKEIEILNNLLSSKNLDKQEILLKLKDDKDDTKVEIVPFYDELQTKYFYILIFSKVLASKALVTHYKYLEKTYNNILDLVGDSFFILDENFNTTYLSDNLYKTFLSQDYKPNVNSITDILGEELSNKIIDVCKTLTEKTYVFEIKFEKVGSQTKFFKIHIGKYFIEESVRYYCFFENITDKVQYIDKIQHYEKLLLQEHFNYEVVIPKLSHKLNNYINSINGLIELLEDYQNVEKNKIEKFVYHIKNNSNTLLVLFEKVMDFQLLDRRVYDNKSSYLIKDIIEELIVELNEIVTNKNKVVSILLSNSSIKSTMQSEILIKIIKYLLFNKTMIENFENFDIDITTITNQANKLEISFNLKAGPSDKFNQLVDSLQNLDIANLDNFDHFAFDFYIAGKLLEKYDTKLNIIEKDGNKVIHFLIHLEQLTTKAQKVKYLIDKNYFANKVNRIFVDDQINILIIEDDNINCEIISNYLNGFNFDIVSKIEHAKQLLEQNTYNYLFTKLDFENKKELFEFTSSVKSKYNSIKIIAITGLTNEKIENLSNFGFDYLIYKPYSIYDLNKILGVV